MFGFISATIETPTQTESTTTTSTTNEPLFATTFELPIQYLKNKHILPPSIIKDLELIETLDGTNNDGIPSGVYKVLFDVKSGETFKQQLLKKQSEYYTTDVGFINDTIEIIKSSYIIDDTVMKPVNDEKIIEIWHDLKDDEYFLEKYSYMEWSYLENLNNSSFFLWLYACMNIISPLLTFLIPIIFIILPIILMVVFGEPITLQTYYSYMKDLSRQHFIGTILGAIDGSITWDKMTGVLVSAMFYGISIYQNIIGGYHFYNNMKQVNDHLIEIRDYLVTTEKRMENFVKIAKGGVSYAPFLRDLANHQIVIAEMKNEVENVRAFAVDFQKCGELGELLSAFYKLHKSSRFESSLRYSMGFNAYYASIQSIGAHLAVGNVHECSVGLANNDDEVVASIKQQYYPLLQKETAVKNDVSFGDNIVLTGSNGCGKSTLMKTSILNFILAQQTGVGFFDEMHFIPFENFHCYLNIVDTGANNDSLFMAQSRRSKEIMSAIVKGGSHFCILDEIFCGTEIDSCRDACIAFIGELTKNNRCRFILSTHIVDVATRLEGKTVENHKMEVVQTGDDIKNTYRIVPGISNVRGAVSIFKKMDFPQSFIDSVKSSLQPQIQKKNKKNGHNDMLLRKPKLVRQ
jgi:ABC-type Na+ transport system ATPase subunit NatA